MNTAVRARHAARGFSLVELLVTIVLAGIIFAAMFPVFVSALKKTSGDQLRVVATNIAQDRLEKVRQLKYADITLAHLNDSSYAGGQFGTSYTPPASSKTYTIAYTVDKQSNYTKVAVRVSGSATDYVTNMKTIVMDPAAISVTSTSNPYPSPSGGYTLTVAFKNYTQVTSAGVTVVYVTGSPTPYVTVTATPTKQVPNASHQTVTWTGLPGGRNIPYTVTCHSSYITSTAPIFHLLSNGWLKFDTHPGGS